MVTRSLASKSGGPVFRQVMVAVGVVSVVASGWGQTTAYDFGAPDPSEQLMLEYVNRSRLFPGVEAQGYRDAADATKRAPDQLDWNLADTYKDFGVNMAVAVQRIAAMPVVPPVAPNAKLMAAARQHTQWMFANRVQTHTQPPSTTASDSIVRRINAVGYSWAGVGENIYSYGRDIYYTQASFEVDWGGSDYGMQKPAGHRLNNHSKDHREVGIGLRLGYSGYGASDVGPVVNTMDFGSQRSSPAFITGVAYYDLNGNQRYDLNEGIEGLKVEVTGASQHAMTASGGGYAVPVPAAAATRTAVLSGLRAAGQTSVVMTDGANVKLDFTPAYVAPVIAEPAVRVAGVPMDVSFPTTFGATAYEVVTAEVAAAAPEPLDGPASVSSFVTPGRYVLVQSTVRVGTSGSAVHLAHPELEDQWVMLKPTYVPGATGTVTFQSWLRGSSARQVARCQVSVDDGVSWTDVWTKVGAATGATGWAPVTVSLAAQSGRLVRLRFNYTLKGNSWMAGLGTTSGWFIDNVAFSDVEQLSAIQTTTVAATGSTGGVAHTPTAGGTLLLAARPVISGRPWAYGPSRRVAVEATSPFVQWTAREESRLGLEPGALASGRNHAGRSDGLPALVKYALGLSADQNASSRLPQPEVAAAGLCVTYFRDVSRDDVRVALEVSGDYEHWAEPGSPGAPVVLSDTVLGLEGTLERRCAIIAPDQGRVAARLRVTPR